MTDRGRLLEELESLIYVGDGLKAESFRVHTDQPKSYKNRPKHKTCA